MLKKTKYSLLVVLISTVVLIVFYFFKSTGYLQFSDAAKIGEVARSINTGSGFSSRFVLFTNGMELNNNSLFSARVVSPLSPYLTAITFKLFGKSDFSIILVSMFSFVLMGLLTYLLAKKLFGNRVGIISAIFVTTNLSLLNYAITGASEIAFICLMLGSIYFAVTKTKLSRFVSLILLIVLFLTRPHAPFYIFSGLFLLTLFATDNLLKTAKIIGGILILALVVIALSFVTDISFLNVLKERIVVSLAHNSTFAPANDVLRINQTSLISMIQSNIPALVSKLFYNLYNFYKLIPDIFSPYIFVLLLISLFFKSEDKKINYFRYYFMFLAVIVFTSTAITAPLYRYLHPLIPLMTILATWSLVSILEKMSFDKYALPILIVFISLGTYFGNVFLDSRFERNVRAYGKPPVYKLLADKLRDNTNDKQIIVTNLDTWGSWYGDRKTVWYPLKPQDLENTEDNVDAIYLTSYLMDDENNYMGSEWREIFTNPNNFEMKYISENYKFVKEFSIKPEENFEKVEARGVLLMKNDK